MTDTDPFTQQVREFLRQHLPDDIRDAARANALPPREHVERWQRILHAHGWGAPGWPAEFGGTGWDLTQYAIFLRECAMADCPRADNLGLATIGPAIMRFGTPDQQQRFLPAIVRFEDYWAQAFSEPGAGSDLASLSTQARLEGDQYIVNGTKIWTSHSHWANRFFALVRTEKTARRQDGISVLLIDKDTPGLTVRPIRFINGSHFHFEIFFDDVRVPAERLLGAPGSGWEIARHMLVEERLFLARLPECERDLARLADMGARRGPDGRRLGDEPWFQRRLAEMCMRLDGYSSAWWRTLALAQDGQDVGLASSVYRLLGTSILQDLNEQQLEAAGEAGLAVDPASLAGEVNPDPLDAGRAENIHLHHLRYRGITLGAGSAEIQRGIVSRALLAHGEVPLEPLPEAVQPLAEAARRFVQASYTFERRREIVAAGGHDRKAWQELAGLGLFGALVPEQQGGIGLDGEGLAAMAVALGEALIVEPWYWPTAIAAALARHGAAALPGGLIDGSRRVALATGERSVRADPHAFRGRPRRADGGWLLDVALAPVWGGAVADELWVPVTLEGAGSAVLRVDVRSASLDRRNFRTYDGRSACLATLAGHRFASQDLVLAGAAADRFVDHALDCASLCESAEVVGAMRRGLEITIEHLRTRKQFGRPLADFQALQHRLADHYVRLFQLDAFVRAAGQALAKGRTDRSARIAAAKWAAARYGRQVGHDVLQMHGAIGLQDETPACHYAKRMLASGAMLGDAEIQIDRYQAAWEAGLAPNAARPAGTAAALGAGA